MSEQITRPEPASTELAERARRVHRTAADEIASTLGYWTPETLAAGAAGVGGLLIWHPAALPIAGLLLAARITAARLARRRTLRERNNRFEREKAELAARRAQEDQTRTDIGTDDAGREGIA
ncbi:hypothetical protein [Saccharomonospora piscinae]|uniref:hypothetical protein n=1 Tax=Saccharomonospora piscinae TaxID=687388 RepID=UPI0004641C4B|nr:hypothetical protein [Saccharomonospora piscinae]